jgi:hypothetical protein
MTERTGQLGQENWEHRTFGTKNFGPEILDSTFETRKFGTGYSVRLIGKDRTVRKWHEGENRRDQEIWDRTAWTEQPGQDRTAGSEQDDQNMTARRRH